MDYLDHLVAEKAKGNQARLGLLFDTLKHNYFLDSGTNKVVLIEESIEYEFLNHFLSDTVSCVEFDAFMKLHAEEPALNDFIHKLEEEHLLQAFEVDDLHSFSTDASYEERLMNHFEQITLEVTGNCNFRCKYCIYSEHYEGNRDFNTENMTWETAKQAIDFALTHSNDEVAITFYGGEPLLNYKLMRSSIDYALQNGNDKKMSFSFTSNMSLMTQDMAEYFAGIPNLSILASIDGPEEIHNFYRVYANDRPSFNDAMRGVEYTAKAFKQTGNVLAINAVYTPPYSYAKVERMDQFFRSLPFLEGVNIQVSYPSPGTLFNIEKYFLDDEDKNEALFDIGNPLAKWVWDSILSGDDSSLAKQYAIDAIKTVHFRPILDKPVNYYHQNACCVPGVRRLYVKTNGDLTLCERIGNSPAIGNITTGVDISRVYQFYIDGYVKPSLPDCSKCWAINMCNVCYQGCYSYDGFDAEKKRRECYDSCSFTIRALQIYHYLLETCPDKLELLKGVELY